MTAYRFDATYDKLSQVVCCPKKFVYFCLSAVPFFANKCAQSFYRTNPIESKGPVYSRASWTFELLYNCVGSWRFRDFQLQAGPSVTPMIERMVLV